MVIKAAEMIASQESEKKLEAAGEGETSEKKNQGQFILDATSEMLSHKNPEAKMPLNLVKSS